MSKKRYLEVQACIKLYGNAYINLPEGWDAMSDADRTSYIKQTSHEVIAQTICDDYQDTIPQITCNRLYEWEVLSIGGEKAFPLEDVVKKTKRFLELEEIYEHKNSMDDGEDD